MSPALAVSRFWPSGERRRMMISVFMAFIVRKGKNISNLLNNNTLPTGIQQSNII